MVRNPYIDLPLPVDVVIDFGFFLSPSCEMERKFDENRARVEVRRALTAYAYANDDSESV